MWGHAEINSEWRLTSVLLIFPAQFYNTTFFLRASAKNTRSIIRLGTQIKEKVESSKKNSPHTSKMLNSADYLIRFNPK